MRGRFGSGIVQRMGLGQLAACSMTEYEDIASRLALESSYRKEVIQAIEDRRAILYGDVAPIRALEEFLMHEAAAPSSSAHRAKR